MWNGPVPPLYPTPGQIAANIQAQAAAHAGWLAAQGGSHSPAVGRELTPEELEAYKKARAEQARLDKRYSGDQKGHALYLISALHQAGVAPVPERTRHWRHVDRKQTLFRKEIVSTGVRVVCPAYYPIGDHRITEFAGGDMGSSTSVGPLGITLDARPVIVSKGLIPTNFWSAGALAYVSLRTAVIALDRLAAEHGIVNEWAGDAPTG